MTAALSALLLSAGDGLAASPADIHAASVQNTGRTVCDRDLKHAVELYGRGLYAQAESILDGLPEECRTEESEGYRVLCSVCLGREGYHAMMENYIERYPYSGLIPQMRFRHALNLFDAEDYAGASAELEQLSRRQLYRRQVPEFLFRKAYCDLENGLYDRALQRFDGVLARPVSDYTAPSQYFSGYILYQKERFTEAADRFVLSARDPRFAEISNYYILECRFMDKDYAYVTAHGPEMMPSVPEGRRPQLARLISESFLVQGDAVQAREYFDMDVIPEEKKTRTDYFYAGSVLYAVKDWAGAADNFSRMTDRTDSLGQIASYQMAFSYIQLKNKVAAMEAFREASVPQYDPVIAEDAYYNYAKLAFDLNNDISGFDGYLAKYSDLKRGDRVYSYIAVGALRNRDYASAVEAYDKVEELDPVMKTNYMKANYLRANELVRDGSWRAAVPCLRAAAYYSDRREMFNQMSRFWLAEAYYRDGQYDKSLTVLRELYNTSALYGMEESRLIPYNMAYCYFQQEDFSEADRWFKAKVNFITLDEKNGVEKINKVRFVSPEGATHFEVVFVLDNPGTLTEGMEASASLTAADGTPIYPYQNGKLEFYETTVVKAKASGPVESFGLLDYADVKAGQVLVQLGATNTDQEISTKEEALKTAQEKLKEANDELSKYNGVAPIDGTVLSCSLTEGAQVESGQGINIADTSQMTVEISVDERNAQYVKVGMMVDLDQFGTPYMGVVESVALTASGENGVASIPAVVKVDNPDGSMIPGTYITYSFVASQSDDCMMVPMQSVKNIPGEDGSTDSVVFIRADKRPENAVDLEIPEPEPGQPPMYPSPEDGFYPVKVETGLNDDYNVEIKSGLNGDEEVFVNYLVESAYG